MLAEGRQIQLKDVQAVIQILAELPLVHEFRQVAVGCGDEAEIRILAAAHPDLLDLIALQHAQQLCLKIQREFADLVEKDRALVRQFELALLPAFPRSGKGALHIAEQFRFSQFTRQGRTVY